MPKVKNQKQKVLEKIGVGNFNIRRPVLAVLLNDTDNALSTFFNELIDGIKNLPVNLILLDSDYNYKNLTTIAVDKSDEVFEASDIVLFLSSSKGVVEFIKKAYSKKTVPVTYNIKNSLDMIDYNPVNENGNSFVYKNFNKWEIFAALVRALENYKFPYDWDNIIRKGCRDVGLS